MECVSNDSPSNIQNLSQLQPLSEFIMYRVSQLKIATLASILTVIGLLDGEQRGPTFVPLTSLCP